MSTTCSEPTPAPNRDPRLAPPWKAAGGRLRIAVLCAALAVASIALYSRAGSFGFLSLDDGDYVSANPFVQSGLSVEGLAWGFSFEAKERTYWHPVTWLSHMLDVELFGMRSGAHHLVNVFLHLLNGILLFLFLRRTSGCVWSSGIAAALFAVHPLNVESVAWVAERKNVLSTAFWMLSLMCYAQYVHSPRRTTYAALLVAFTLGLLSKPMIVTLPFALLLLDVWPLGRLRLFPGASPPVAGPCGTPPHAAWDPIKEKIPLFLLAALTVYLANNSMRFSEATVSFHDIPLSFRLANMAVSYVTYLSKIIFPTDLAVFYPYPREIAVGRILAAILTLGGLSVLAAVNLKKRPYLMVGWLWFLGTLVPVSGIVQVGLWPAWADRWAYLPQIGLILAGVWGVRDLMASARAPRAAWPSLLAASIVIVLALSTYRQTGIWENDIALYQHALRKVPDSFLAHSNMGSMLLNAGRTEEGMAHLHEAARLSPEHSFPVYTLALQRLYMENPESAAPYLLRAVTLDPRLKIDAERAPTDESGIARRFKTFLGDVLFRSSELSDKIALNNIGALFMLMGDTAAAVEAFQAALGIDPRFADAHNNIGFVYMRTSRYAEASDHFERALAIEPENRAALNNLKDLSAVSRAN